MHRLKHASVITVYTVSQHICYTITTPSPLGQMMQFSIFSCTKNR